MKQDKQTKLYPYLYQSVLLVTLLLAAGLRFAKLDTQSFWNDEGNTARLVERSIPLILSGAAGDVHPPGYYLILRVWRMFTGETEFALRSYSALCGVVTVALTAGVTKYLFGEGKTKSWIMGMPALWFITLHPLSVYYSQEARMYAQLGLAAVSLLWAAVKFQKAVTESSGSVSPRQRSTTFILLAGMVAFGLYTHYAFVFALCSISFAFGIYWLIYDSKNWRILLSWLGAHVAGSLVFIPWAPIALRASGWRPPDLGTANAVQSLVRTLVVGVTLPEQKAVYILPVLAVFGLLVLAKLPRAPFAAWASFSMTLIPLLIIVVFDLYRPAYLKFLIISIGPLAVCLSALRIGKLAGVHKRYWTKGVLFCLLLVFTPAQISALQHLYSDPSYARDDYRGIVTYIASQALDGDAVLLNAPNQWEVFTYYYRGDLPIYTAPYRPTAQDAVNWVQDVVKKHPQLFVLYWGEREADPGRLIEVELAQQAFKSNENWVSSVRLTRYGTSKKTLSPHEISGVSLGSNIHLVRYDLPDTSHYPGEILPLTLVWSVSTTPSERYKVFIHLVDDTGMLIAQTDAEPVGGFNLTSQWVTGAEINDNYGILLPGNIPSGQYRVLVGMYDFSGNRLPVSQNGRLVGDTVLLDALTVVPRQ